MYIYTCVKRTIPSVLCSHFVGDKTEVSV